MNYITQVPQAAGLTPQQTRGAFNNAMAQAQASADMRFNMKPLDRAGVSRGGAQRLNAGISSATNLADGIRQAYSIPASDAAFNANIGLANASAQEGTGLGVSQLDQQSRYASALEALQRQQALTRYRGQALGGLLGGDWLSGFLGY